MKHTDPDTVGGGLTKVPTPDPDTLTAAMTSHSSDMIAVAWASNVNDSNVM